VQMEGGQTDGQVFDFERARERRAGRFLNSSARERKYEYELGHGNGNCSNDDNINTNKQTESNQLVV
jgi:hypothetical protein